MDKIEKIRGVVHFHDNYSALRAFIAGINQCTSQHDDVMAILSSDFPTELKNLQSWNILFGSSRSHRTYRMALENSSHAVIPAMYVVYLVVPIIVMYLILTCLQRNPSF